MKREKTSLYYSFIKKFVILIIIPFLIIVSFFYTSVNRINDQNSKILSEKVYSQTIFSLEQKLDVAQELALSLNTNQRLVTFLNREYRQTVDLEFYETVIYNNVIASTGSSSSNTLKILYENESIPQGYGIFYRIKEMLCVKQISDFYNDKTKQELWLDGNSLTNIPPYIQFNPFNSYCYFKKIEVRNKTLGLIIVSVPKTTLFDSDNRFYASNSLYNSSDTSIITYNYTDDALDDNTIASITSLGESSQTIGNSVVNLHRNQKYPFDIVTVTPGNSNNKLFLFILLTILFLFTIAITIFIKFIKNIIRDISYCLDAMNESITNNFETTLTVKRHDEISKITDKINYLLNEIKLLIGKAVRQQLVAKEAQLIALQHQINPHFLYNTMEIFSSRMEIQGLYNESAGMAAFCRMLRYNINSETMLTSFREEFNQIQDYILIQKLKKIEIFLCLDIEADLLDELIIKFILQPFIENSVKYRHKDIPLHIKISVTEAEGVIGVSISDNGLGISTRQLTRLNTMFTSNCDNISHSDKSIGLFNINKRLVLFYGQKSSLTAKSDQHSTTFSFEINPSTKIELLPTEND